MEIRQCSKEYFRDKTCFGVRSVVKAVNHHIDDAAALPLCVTLKSFSKNRLAKTTADDQFR